MIDDGSPDPTAQAAADAGATVLEHVHNQGKGAALQTGFDHARASGCDLAITLDGDGQHAPSDIPAFRKAYERTRSPVLVGNRMGDVAAMPWLRRRTNLAPTARACGVEMGRNRMSSDRIRRLFMEFTRLRQKGCTRDEAWARIEVMSEKLPSREHARLLKMLRDWEAAEGVVRGKGGRDEARWSLTRTQPAIDAAGEIAALEAPYVPHAVAGHD